MKPALVALILTLGAASAAPALAAIDGPVRVETGLVTGGPICAQPQGQEGAGKVVTHRQLLAAVRGPAHEYDVQHLRVFVGQLRQKIEPSPSAPSLILTEAGVGYCWVG